MPQTTAPSKELLTKLDMLTDPLNEAWNMTIDERDAAPLLTKTDLRNLTDDLELILVKLQDISDKYPLKISGKKS